MIEFLSDNKSTLNKANELFKRCRKIRCAVAFWGVGAETLFSNIPAKDIKVICNLTTGGTNPQVIEDIIKRSPAPEFKKLDVLHAKIYWTEIGAIIGSANASVNGLGFENTEIRGWKEASLFVDDAALLLEIELWFDKLWAQSSLITKSDILLAKAKWQNRRKNLPPLPSASGSLTDDVKNGLFAGRPVYIIIDTVFMNAKQRAKGNKLKVNISKLNPRILENSISYWLDYPKIPRNVIAYCYYVEEGKIKFDGVYYTLDKKYDQKLDKRSNFQYGETVKNDQKPIVNEKLNELSRLVKTYYNKHWEKIEKKGGDAFKIEKLFTLR